MNIYKIDERILTNLKTISVNENFLQKYFELIEKYVLNPPCEHYERHHILPSSLFPEFKKLKTHKWNEVKLPYGEHLFAHYLLAIFTEKPAMYKAFNLMAGMKRNKSHVIMLTEQMKEEYQKLKEKMEECFVGIDKEGKSCYVSKHDPRVISGEIVGITKGKKTVKHIPTGKTLSVDKNDPKYATEEYEEIHSGKLMARIIATGETIQITKEEYKNNRDIYEHVSTGLIPVKNLKTGENLSVTSDDPRYISGELIHVSTGLIPVKNPKTGETFAVTSDDPRYISGELVHNTVGLVSAKNPLTGETLSVDKNDPRLKTGELVGVTSGKRAIRHIDSGTIIMIDKCDTSLLDSGEYEPVNAGYVSAKNPVTGEKLIVKKDDKRLKTGELVGITKGNKKYNNGIINKSFDPRFDVIPEGFVLGALPKTKNHLR